jgi:hypothetical protein
MAKVLFPAKARDLSVLLSTLTGSGIHLHCMMLNYLGMGGLIGKFVD